MKRVSQGGNSPASKFHFLCEDDSDPSSQEITFSHCSNSTPSESLGFGVNQRASQDSSNPPLSQNLYDGHLLDVSSDSSNPTFEPHSDVGSDPEINSSLVRGWHGHDMDESYSEVLFDDPTFEDSEIDLALQSYVTEAGASAVATKILDNEEIRKEIVKQIFSSSHKSLKSSLKKSRLTARKKDRNYLLSLTPRILCEEFKENSISSFDLLVRGLLGISEEEEIFDSQFLLNNIALLYSTVGKILNRQAVGYALLLTTAARDGGLREDSLKIFSFLVHPRTSQKYDQNVLAVGWDTNLKDSLEEERAHFEKLKAIELKIEMLLQEGAAVTAVEAAHREFADLLDSCPPQFNLVWDNLNLRTKRRFRRAGDDYSTFNLDWMASLWIKDRIDANHMDHREGIALKDVENLSIKDMVPSDEEKSYIFRSLISYYSHRLVQRHPQLFKSVNRSIRPNRPHQFQKAMDGKSEESTGNMFTQSESCTEELIQMMSEVQLNVHTFEDKNGVKHCHEKKILSGDNKTEKNMHYGILRSAMQ